MSVGRPRAGSIFVVLLVLVALAGVGAEASAAPASGARAPAGRTKKPAASASPSVEDRLVHPVHIAASRFRIDDPSKLAVWTGNVKASRGGTDLFCDTLVAHYLPGATQKVERIECEGNVRGLRGDTEVRGQRADFDNLAGVIVVTGQPSARSGPNRMTGDEIRFDVERDILEVKPATTVFESVPQVSGQPSSALGQAAKPGTPVEIQSETFVHENLRREATWAGRVRVRRGDTRLVCGRLVAQYSEGQQLRALQCTRGAEVWAGDVWAKGERADYDPARDVVLVTGNPEARQGPNHTRGSRVYLHPSTRRIEVDDPVTVFEVPKDKGPRR